MQILQYDFSLLQLHACAVQVRVTVVEADSVAISLVTNLYAHIRCIGVANMLKERKRIHMGIWCVQVTNDHDAAAHIRDTRIANVVGRRWLYQLTCFLQASVGSALLTSVVNEDVTPVANQLSANSLLVLAQPVTTELFNVTFAQLINFLAEGQGDVVSVRSVNVRFELAQYCDVLFFGEEID